MEMQFSNIPISLDAMLPKNEALLHREVMQACGIKKDRVKSFRIIKKSVDARRKSNVHYVVTAVLDILDVNDDDLSRIKPRKGISAKPYKEPARLMPPDLSAIAKAENYERPVVVGAGPAGLFCALYLARAGLRPLVLERGKPAPERLQDVRAFADGGALDANSNVQFGEGGAGTFSDGKLNTGIKSPHIRHVLQEFVSAGAPEDILVNAKPHIGTDKLVDVVQNLRHAIETAGGEFSFSTCLEEIEFDEVAQGASASNAQRNGETPTLAVRAIKVRHLQETEETAVQTIPANILVLAIGHSARDTFQMLQASGIKLKRKQFAAGLRIEHLQEDINRSQYGRFANHPALGAADYKLATRTSDNRGVYTFCMCPGGEVVAAASEEGGVCVNGMSEHARGGKNANSALLVEVKPEDLPGENVLEGIEFQRKMERAAYTLGKQETGIPYTAPVQTVEEFLENASGTPSKKIDPTYPRAVAWTNIRECLPDFIAQSIAEALPTFGTKLEAFKDGQAVLTGVEARSSSPVNIVRKDGDMCSVSAIGLYPCGEGAGYAGGIMSAAVDGIRVAEAICANM